MSQSVTVCHHKNLSPAVIQSTLEYAGFDVLTSPSSMESENARPPSGGVERLLDRRRTHIQQCFLCQQELEAPCPSPNSQMIIGKHEICSESRRSKCSMSSDNADNVPDSDQPSMVPPLKEDGPFRVTLSVGGMTCSTCSGTIMKMVLGLHGVSEAAVSLLSKSATVIVDQKNLVNAVVETVEGCGFEAEVLTVEPLNSLECDSTTGPRTITLRVDGMFCQ